MEKIENEYNSFYEQYLRVFVIRLNDILRYTPWKWNVINYIKRQGMHRVVFPFTNGPVMHSLWLNET